eukprot:1192955-Prorocentrum_minimum.AAC.3
MKILVGAAGGALFMMLSCAAFFYAGARARAKARRRAGVSHSLLANSNALVRGTNRRRNGRINPGRELIGGGTCDPHTQSQNRFHRFGPVNTGSIKIGSINQ